MRANVIIIADGKRTEVPIYMSCKEYSIEVFGQKTRISIVGNDRRDELVELYKPEGGMRADWKEEPLVSRGDCFLKYTNCIRRVKMARKRLAKEREQR